MIERKIRAIEQAKGIKLIEHSIEECSKLYDHFKSLETVDGKKTVYCRKDGSSPQNFQYTEKEKAWIQNEMFLCACSFPYWFFRYFFIKSTIEKDGEVVSETIRRPDIWVSQLVYLAILADLDLQGLPILLLILKARQLGCSTITEAIILWIAIFTKGSHTVVASAEASKSEEMANMVWLGLEMMPLWMQPVLTRDDRTMGPEFGLIHSDILLQHGSMTKGISRGSTPIAAHLSEVAYYPNPIETIQSSLIRAMHENPRTFLALESTARRKDDWFHNTWKKNRKGEQEGYNRFICLFLPWYVGRDIYPTPDFLKSHPIPKDWKPLKETLSQAADARLYVSTTELLKKHMPENWEMPREQMWFWEFNYVEAKNGTDEDYKSFLAELAADERSCFQSKKWSVFSQKVLDELEANKSDKYQDFAMCGDGIDPKFHLKDFWAMSAPRIDINWSTIEGKTLAWRLIPLKETPRGKNLDFFLRVWERPKAGFKYTIGIDISSGIGENRSVFFVLKEGRNGEPDEEVALLCSAWISAPETPAFAHLLGIWYGSLMPFPSEALMAPEVQISTGDFISFQLAKLGYTNFFYTKRMDLRQHPGQKPTRRGFAMLPWIKPMVDQGFEHGIKSGWVIVNSDELLEECGNLEVDETEAGKTVYDHARGATNDVYVAGGIAYFATHGEQTIVERMKGNLKPKKKKEKDEVKTERDSGGTLLARRFQMEDSSKFPNAGDEGEQDPLAYIH